jgi:hypothetical protein
MVESERGIPSFVTGRKNVIKLGVVGVRPDDLLLPVSV